MASKGKSRPYCRVPRLVVKYCHGSYQYNGNTQGLRRNKSTEDSGNAMDDLAYEYDNDRPNRLLQVREAAGDAPNAEDIAYLGHWLENSKHQIPNPNLR